MDKTNSKVSTSPSLLLRIRDPSDRESWETFERIYGAIIRSYCRHWKLQEVDADDVTQEVLSAVAKQIQTFEYDPAKGRFRAWLGTITANQIKRLIARKIKHRNNGKDIGRQCIDINANELEGVYADPDSDWVTIFSEQILAEACRNVRPDFEAKTWSCFEATWIEQLSPAEVAESLGVTVHAVYVNKSRVMKRLELEILSLAEDMAINSSQSNHRNRKA